jgi:hypothetical protein
VDKYNKDMNDRSHLLFIQVVGGQVWETERHDFYGWGRIWGLHINAKNCSEAGSPSLYNVGLAERFPSDLIHLDDNNFWLYGIYKL